MSIPKLTSPVCLLLDLDGTLVDSARDIARSANHARTGFGLPPLPEETVASFVGDGARRLMQRTMAGHRDDGHVPEAQVEAALRAFREHYIEHCLEETRPYPGVLSTLQALQPLPMAIVSNKPQNMCDKIARGLGLDAWLEVVTGARAGVPVKPDPALLELTLREMGFQDPRPDTVWMVGDSPNDIRSGRAIGATTIAVSYGLTPVDAIRAAAPDHLIDDFRELGELVESARGQG